MSRLTLFALGTRYKRHIQIAIALLIFFSGAVYMTVLYATHYYADALALANTYEEIRIDGAEYIVSQGQVSLFDKTISGIAAFGPLRLAYKKVQAERSPLLALPGVDPVDLKRALQRLRTEQTLLTNLQTDPSEARLVDTSLYPIRFLQNAASLEDARHRFIATGEKSDAREYSKLLKKTTSAFHHDLSLFAEAFETLIPPTTHTYRTLMSTIDRPSTIDALESLQMSSTRINLKFLARELCTYAVVALCDSRDLHLPEVSRTSGTEIANSALTDDVRKMYVSAAYPLDDTPTVVLTSSACIPDTMSASFAFVRYGANATDASMTPFYVGDIILVDSDRYRSSPFFRYFNDKGIRYILVDPLTYYECPDALGDFSSSLTNVAIAQFARDTDVKQHLSTTTAAQIEVLAERLERNTVVDLDAAAYIHALKNALPLNQETKHLHRTLEEFALALTYRTAGLSELISTIVIFESGNRTIENDGAAFDTGAKNLFHTRSGFASLFLTTHPHVTSADEPIFPPHELTADNLPYEYFSDLRRVDGLRETIRSDLTFFRTAHFKE